MALVPNNPWARSIDQNHVRWHCPHCYKIPLKCACVRKKYTEYGCKLFNNIIIHFLDIFNVCAFYFPFLPRMGETARQPSHRFYMVAWVSPWTAPSWKIKGKGIFMLAVLSTLYKGWYQWKPIYSLPLPLLMLHLILEELDWSRTDLGIFRSESHTQSYLCCWVLCKQYE